MSLETNSPQPPEQNSSTLRQAGAFVWDLVKILLIALVIIIPFRMFVAEPFVVSGSSMVPNFHNHDYLIVDRLSYLTGNPQRGDVIVLLYPKDTSQFFIKRVIGLPGESISFNQQGDVIIYNTQYPQGEILNESAYLPAGVPTYGQSQPIHLASGEYFVLGDNRTASSDSRVWGILPRDDIVGKVWLRAYPLSDAGFFHTPSY
jgi:signal peptidase I